MTLQDLEEHGVLLPEEEWGTHELSTTVPEGPMLAALGLAVAGLVALYVGGGDIWTWVGLGAFLLALYAIMILCDRAVVEQRKRVEEDRGQRGKHSEPGEG